MAKQIILMPFIFILWASLGQAQKADDPVLFMVENTKVKASEFDYIYSKTNGQDADYSKASLQEYLDLYVKFKLKVQKARDMKLDTIVALQQELEGYRKQLADSYLMDREVTNKLVEEAYNRKKQDVEVYHILKTLNANATSNEAASIREELSNIKKEIENGATFEDMAKKYSDDGISKRDGGKVGYLTAVLPNGFYDFETAIYTLEEGQISDPIRTNFGYHILKVANKRPARGQLEVAHILLRTAKDGSDSETIKGRIDKIYTQLQNGDNFDALAKAVSQDKATANQGGYLGTFGIGQYEKSFEDAAFALTKEGDVSMPVKTQAGWHIIKLVNKKPVEAFNQEKAKLEQQVRQDGRFELARQALIERIKKENNFTKTTSSLTVLKDTLGEDFLTFRWRAPEQKPKAIIFNLGSDRKITIGEFLDYAQRSARDRIQIGRREGSVAKTVDILFDNFVAEEALKYEEDQLEDKYPDFKALMREYQEGILLFEATKMLVWDKASEDTTGLKTFFKTIDGKYKWDKRAVVTRYSVKSAAINKLEDIRKYAKNHSMQEVLDKFNNKSELVTAAQETIEKGRNKLLDATDWTAGSLTENESNKQEKTIYFNKIEEVIPPTPKTLREARGYVVADYQDYLEKQWVAELKNEYDVKINKRVLNKMAKK